MTKLPPPNDGIDTLKSASVIREAISAGDASTMISDGFTLIGVCPQKNDEDHPFRYSLAWLRPLDEMEYIVRQRWRI